MKVIRWGAALGVALSVAITVGAAPSAFAASGVEAVGLAERGAQLVSFNTSDPSKVKLLGNVSGTGGEKLVGIDFRPKDHRLYGVTTGGKIYTFDNAAKGTQVGKLSVALKGSYLDIDFTADGNTLRIVSDTGQNLSQPFDAAGPKGATVKNGDLSRRNIAAIAYTGANRLLGIDTPHRRLIAIDPATGKVTDVGPANGFPTISTSSNGLDVAGSNAFATVNLNHYHTLFRVDTASGKATKVGVFNPSGDGAESFRHVIDLTIRR